MERRFLCHDGDAMTAWTKRIALYIDVDSAGGAPLLSAKSSTRLSTNPAFMQGDKVRLELWFRSLASSPLNASTVAELAAGSKIAVAAKLASALDSATVLFSAFDFSLDGSGDDICYYADLDLNTQEIDDVFSEQAAASADIKVDIEVQNSDNTDRLTFQFDGTLKQQVYDNEPSTTPGTPPNYSAAECEARFVPRSEDQAFARFHAGTWYHYIAASEPTPWHPEVAALVDGIPVLTLGPGESL
jgi:hypothetical protein